jgi:leucyl-tRNA synthetase
MEKYDPKAIEAKWRKYWQDNQIYKLDLDKASRPFYNLMMFPYPSAEGLHIGGMYTFTGVDTYGRFMRMKGYDVFEPIGLDAFGIHSENYALKIGEHIKVVSQRTHKHFFEQLHMMGNMYDWDRTVETNEPDYYKWTQWLFVQFFKAGLAYRKQANVKYCPSCKTVLSDEQVIDDRCERCSSLVETKALKQWFFKITKYADRLDRNLKKIDWVDDVKLGQKNWIGKKEGINIRYQIKGTDLDVTCFTTRPDTNFGATFIVIAPEHPLAGAILSGDLPVSASILNKVKKYIEQVKGKTDIERIAEGKKKTGVDTGFIAINNLNDRELPIYISDFVLGHFGTGAVVGVPGHDKRDFEFAKEFNLEVIRVVSKDADISPITNIEQVQEDEGKMVNSEFLNGMDIHEATTKIMDYIEEKGWGNRVINYNLRDWCVSRQRYWGPPIPMIYCQACAAKGLSWFNTDPESSKNISKAELADLVEEMKGWYADENLPVKLPDIAELDKIKPDGSGRGPLAQQSEFIKVKCPHCSEPAVRESDVSDPFVDSCWYFLRYPFTEFMNVPFGGDFSSQNSLFDPGLTKTEQQHLINRMHKWGPVTSYIGGKEHTVLHLLYARFITMVFFDLGYLDFEEPFSRFFGHGLITKDGAKMSKSKGNVVNPDEFIERYGADSVRMYLRFIGPFDSSGDWRDSGMSGMFKFVSKLWRLYKNMESAGVKLENEVDDSIVHQTIKSVGEDLESLKFNTAVARIMEFVNWYTSHQAAFTLNQKKEYLTKLALILAPFMPYLAEEFWNICGNKTSVHMQSWPDYEEARLIKDEVRLPVQINGKLRGVVKVSKEIEEAELMKLISKDSKIKGYLDKGEIVKVIYLPGKIINVIVR